MLLYSFEPSNPYSNSPVSDYEQFNQHYVPLSYWLILIIFHLEKMSLQCFRIKNTRISKMWKKNIITLLYKYCLLNMCLIILWTLYLGRSKCPGWEPLFKEVTGQIWALTWPCMYMCVFTSKQVFHIAYHVSKYLITTLWTQKPCCSFTLICTLK